MCIKTLNPEWNQSTKWVMEGKQFKPTDSILLTIYDRDRGSFDDPMGEVNVPLKVLLATPASDKWYPVKPCKGCKDATGELQLKVSVNLRHALSLKQKQSLQVPPTATLVAVG